MSGKHVTLSQIKRILALREIGATRAVISVETGISISTISRICKRFNSRKGAVTAKLVEESKQRLVQRITNDKELQSMAAMLVADDLVTSRIIREKIIEAMVRLDMTEPELIPTNLRALNSASSALATVQKVGRTATGADGHVEALEELPELTIKIMSEQDVEETKEALRQQIKSEDETEVVH